MFAPPTLAFLQDFELYNKDASQTFTTLRLSAVATGYQPLRQVISRCDRLSAVATGYQPPSRRHAATTAATVATLAFLSPPWPSRAFTHPSASSHVSLAAPSRTLAFLLPPWPSRAFTHPSVSSHVSLAPPSRTLAFLLPPVRACV